MLYVLKLNNENIKNFLNYDEKLIHRFNDLSVCVISKINAGIDFHTKTMGKIICLYEERDKYLIYNEKTDTFTLVDEIGFETLKGSFNRYMYIDTYMFKVVTKN